MSRPGASAAEGQHWVYRFDGHRKCWFQAAEGTLIRKKSVRHQAAKHVADSQKSAATPRSRKAVADAHAELRPSAPTDANRPAPPAPEFKVADASPVVATTAAARAPSAPDIAKLPADRLTALNPKADQVDVEMLLAAVPADGDAVVPPVTPGVAVLAAKVDEDGPGWTATLLGVLLMAMGLVVLLSSSRILRGDVLAVR
ncbi:hypothetical protein NLM33_06615 [Bradyrhizobium sp. CCGUVB1N3]|uniref:hypothetical protein n=1 Tax=Bradyrhizobium sp. CCGUVB1N3 TaxID=2949629 RepID=UPI0020B1F07F|nr:hypothetical protein [Bradyrhizobium sp. CCGUVB1N3]MCP3469997.1 hypothetical protein [Bradyrhizobium sp. CCGUVB1N3]